MTHHSVSKNQPTALLLKSLLKFSNLTFKIEKYKDGIVKHEML